MNTLAQARKHQEPRPEMSTSTAVTTREQRREILAKQARLIDEAASGAAALFHGAEVSTEKELLLAMAVVDLRAALTAEVMQPIMSLMNSPLGFLTDKDPSKPIRKQDGSYETPKPYDVDTVRDCVISCKMLGFRVVGNEFNIIAGKFYPAKGGFRRKLTDKLSFPGLTDFRDSYEVPRMVGDKGAIVKCRATWKRNGVDDSLECEFAVKSNANMGTDALLGKAERKLCKRVHDILLGASTPDAEIDEDALKRATETHDTIEVKIRASGVEEFSQNTQHVSPQAGGEQVAKQTDGGNGAVEPQTTKLAPPVHPSQSTKIASLRNLIAKDGISEDAAIRKIHAMFPESETLGTLEEIEQQSPQIINAISRGWASFVSAVKSDGGAK